MCTWNPETETSTASPRLQRSPDCRRELGSGLSARRGLNRELSEREAAGLAPRQTEGCRSRKRSKRGSGSQTSSANVVGLDASPTDDVSQRRNRVAKLGQTGTAATRGRPRRLDARLTSLWSSRSSRKCSCIHPFHLFRPFLSLLTSAPNKALVLLYTKASS